MSKANHFHSRGISIFVFCFCAIAAVAQKPVLEVSARSGVRTDSLHRDLITISLKQGGTPAPDTEVIIEVIEGDAMLLNKEETQLKSSLALTTKNGTQSASVQMRTDPRAAFVITAVVDPNDRTQDVKRSLSLSALDDIPTGEVLKCFIDANNDGRSDRPMLDCREDDTFFTFYSGYAVNNFAAEGLRGGRPGNATAGDIIAGLDFGHALFRRKDGGRRRGELWVYGETLHGVASTNNCDPTQGTGTCDNPNDTTGNLTGVIQDASTLEAYAGLRYEFQAFPWLDESASRFYVKGQAGFISILGKGADLIDNHHAGIGIVKVHGRFTDSYFEVGYGRNDLFRDRNKGRWKVDGLVAMNMKWPNAAMIRPFIQLTADTDIGRGEDSVQTFFGLDFDLTLLEMFPVPGRGVARRR